MSRTVSSSTPSSVVRRRPHSHLKAAGDATAEVHVVPHTHWDREWYLPFAVYRRRLVSLMDDLLARLDAEPGLRFHLDGQMAVIDDYLELRPDRLPPLGRGRRPAGSAWAPGTR